MIIAIVADTHGDIDLISRALALLQPACLLFAGDYYSDGLKLSKMLDIPCYAVAGNCDFDHSLNQEELIQLMGKKILIVHGHQYGVKRDLNRLYYHAKELEADAVVFGHTHMPHLEKINDLWLINPGSPSRPRVPGQASYALLQLKEEGISPSILKI